MPHYVREEDGSRLYPKVQEDIVIYSEDLTTDTERQTDDTGYDEIRHSPEIWIEDSLIHNTESDNFIQAAVELAH